MSARNEKIEGILHDLGARFLSLNGNRASLLTVTRTELTKDGKRATIFFTVFPAKPSKNDLVAQSAESGSRENLEKTALEFAERKRSESRDFIKENSLLGRIPQIDFDIDSGEKNRQKIDTLLNQS